jgi:hypothetical protein
MLGCSVLNSDLVSTCSGTIGKVLSTCKANLWSGGPRWTWSITPSSVNTMERLSKLASSFYAWIDLIISWNNLNKKQHECQRSSSSSLPPPPSEGSRKPQQVKLHKNVVPNSCNKYALSSSTSCVLPIYCGLGFPCDVHHESIICRGVCESRHWFGPDLKSQIS